MLENRTDDRRYLYAVSGGRLSVSTIVARGHHGVCTRVGQRERTWYGTGSDVQYQYCMPTKRGLLLDD
jgi:hypothetical protein